MSSRRRRDGGLHLGGRRAVAEALRAGRARSVLVAEGARSTEGLRDVLAAARTAGVPVRRVPGDRLDRLAPDHRGVVAEVELPSPLGEPDLGRFPFPADAVVVALDGITDPQNLGASARVADAAGAAMLVSRARRAAGVTPAAVRASAGALLHLPHAVVANIPRALRRLQGAGFAVVGLAEDAPASVLDATCPPGPVVIVLGSEGEGLSRLVREACDELVSLPMRGAVGSLNASSALAAALYAYVLPSRATAGR
ncbi:MAG: RNA methyltransferase [Actinobacteria bacterium]|nr:RNA methyltransferase [Actinomycetota bacterium]